MVEWFDDLKVGMRFKSESKTVSKEEILRFASEFDPQPFHLDDEAAKDTILQRACRFRLAYGGDFDAVGALCQTIWPASAVRRRRRRVALDGSRCGRATRSISKAR